MNIHRLNTFDLEKTVLKSYNFMNTSTIRGFTDIASIPFRTPSNQNIKGIIKINDDFTAGISGIKMVWISESIAGKPPRESMLQLGDNCIKEGSGILIIEWGNRILNGSQLTLTPNKNYWINVQFQSNAQRRCAFIISSTTFDPFRIIDYSVQERDRSGSRNIDNETYNCGEVPNNVNIIQPPLRWGNSWQETHDLGSEIKTFIINTNDSNSINGILETHYTSTNPTVRTMWITRCPGEPLSNAINNRGIPCIVDGVEAAVLRWTQIGPDQREFYLEPNSTYYLNIKNAHPSSFQRSSCNGNCPFHLMLTTWGGNQ
jgi:hypothetical protein